MKCVSNDRSDREDQNAYRIVEMGVILGVHGPSAFYEVSMGLPPSKLSLTIQVEAVVQRQLS